MRRADYVAALQAADRLCSRDSLPQRAVARCGGLFDSLAGAVNQKKADVGVEGPALTERSRQSYEKAITMDPDDVASFEGMASVLGNLRNADYSRAFLPHAQEMLSTHPRVSSLARALSGMCASMGNNVMALNYAAMWQRAALERCGARRRHHLRVAFEGNGRSQQPAQRGRPALMCGWLVPG